MSAIDTALRNLTAALDRGDWGAGERLPPERVLAGQLGVGRSTLRKVLEVLEEDGKLRRHVGQGTFVTGARQHGVVATLRLDPPPSPSDVLELRLMVEPDIAATAALRATAPEIEELRDAVEGARRRTGWEEWEEADTRFHIGIAGATRNPLLVGVLNTLDIIRRQREWGQLRSTTLNPDRQRTYVAQHLAVVEAIARRDPPGAAAAMRIHLAAVRDAMIAGDATPA